LKFKQIINRLTGLSTPVFGISWNRPQSHITVARNVITFLEDRRVLYNPYEMEVPSHCIHSVIEILTAQIADLADDDGICRNLRAMRAACRKFLDTIHDGDGQRPTKGIWRFGGGGASSWIFNSALGELRGVIGVHLAALAVQQGFDVEDKLSTILPAEDNQEK
jgi:hypothetical protein